MRRPSAAAGAGPALLLLLCAAGLPAAWGGGLAGVWAVPGDMEDAVAAAVAAQRCVSGEDIVHKDGNYEVGDEIMVYRIDPNIFIHARVFSVGFGGRRAADPADEVYRLEFDNIDTGARFQSKVPAAELRLSHQRCDSKFADSPKYRFIRGENVEVKCPHTYGKSFWAMKNITCGTVCATRCIEGFVPVDGRPGSAVELYVCGGGGGVHATALDEWGGTGGVWNRVATMDSAGSPTPHLSCRRKQLWDYKADPSATSLRDILGVPYDTSPEDLDRAYRKAANIFHPDKPDGSDSAFKLIRNAQQELLKGLELPRGSTALRVETTHIVGCPAANKTKRGDRVHIHYTASVASTGKEVDKHPTDADPGANPYTFRLGDGSANKGMDLGMYGMCVGERRTLTVPFDLTKWQEKGGAERPNGELLVPPYATFLWDIELKKISAVTV